jgi:6-phosphogluconolactonase
VSAEGHRATEIRVVADPAAAYVEVVREALADPRGANIVLAGGSTPKAAYRILSGEPALFKGATLWFGDERCVPPDDERSNYRMVRESMLDSLDNAAIDYVCHRIPGEGGPEVAALAYQRTLEDAGASTGTLRFSLVLLGIGSDCHTLSLFPGQASVLEQTRPVVGVREAAHDPFVPRVTLTLPALAWADHVVVLATGEEKAQAVREAFGPDASPSPQLPASLVPAAITSGSLTVLLDSAAAAGL